MTVSDLYRALWRHRGFIVVMTAGLVGLTWFLTARQTKEYTASTVVRVQQSIANATEAFGALQTGERLARTYAQIAEASPVAAQVYDELNRSVPRSEIKIDAEQVQDLELLRLSVTNPSPTRAAAIANAAPAALSAFIKRTGSLRDKISTVEPATVPTSPSSPNLRLNLALALLLGLIFNGALALLVDALSDRVGTAEELEQATGHPVLTTVPNLKLVNAGLVRASAATAPPTPTGLASVTGIEREREGGSRRV